MIMITGAVYGYGIEIVVFKSKQFLRKKDFQSSA